MRLNPTLKTYLKPALTWWRGLLPREKRIVVGGAVCLLALLIYVMVDAAIGYINQQTIELANSQQKLHEVEEDLVTYAQLLKRKDSLENHFRTIEIKEGVRTLIERLLREKGEVKETPSIRDLPPSSLGEEYEVVQYSVNFSISSMKLLAAFLQELTQGSKPVLITQLDIKKNQRTADRVDVQLNVSSIRPKSV